MRSDEAHFGHHSSATMAKIAEDRACAELASALHKWIFAAQMTTSKQALIRSFILNNNNE
ncbi:MAG: hypothetical protein R2828_03950 [Saprospiraceae bacterium]